MQPDPVGGSSADPQSFNRYAYTVNDPINLIDPLGLCTINIAISGSNLLTPAQFTAMKDELSRIYASAGYDLNFVAKNGDYNMSIDPKAEVYGNWSDGGLTYKSGIRVGNIGRVFIDGVTGSASTASSFARDSKNLGIALGRARPRNWSLPTAAGL